MRAQATGGGRKAGGGVQCSGGFGVGVNKGFVWQLGSLHNPFFHRLARGRLERDRSEDIWAPEMLRDRDHLPLVRDAPTASKRGRRQLMLCTLLPAMLVAAFPSRLNLHSWPHRPACASGDAIARRAEESAMARLMRAEVGDHEGFEVASLTRMRRLRGGTQRGGAAQARGRARGTDVAMAVERVTDSAENECDADTSATS